MMAYKKSLYTYSTANACEDAGAAAMQYNMRNTFFLRIMFLLCVYTHVRKAYYIRKYVVVAYMRILCYTNIKIYISGVQTFIYIYFHEMLIKRTHIIKLSLIHAFMKIFLIALPFDVFLIISGVVCNLYIYGWRYKYAEILKI